MFYAMVSSRIDQLMKTEPVYESDDIRVFIKPEPHKPAKIAEGRLRIISSISAIDTMIDRMIYQDFADAILSSYDTTPIMVGWSPMHSGCSLLKMKLGTGPYLNIDKSSWDWTVPPWLLWLAHHLITELAVMPPRGWLNLHLSRSGALFGRPSFRLSDGSLYKQPVPGIVKSGMYLTILMNSLCQLLLHLVLEDLLDIRTRLPIFMGDDSSQVVFPEQEAYCTLMYRLGFRVKSQISERIEFAGVEVMSWGRFKPLYVAKNFFSLMHQSPDTLPEALQSLQYLYFHDSLLLRELWHVCAQTGNLPSVVTIRNLLDVVVG